MVNDSFGYSDTATVIIEVQDENDNAPVFTSSAYSASIPGKLYAVYFSFTQQNFLIKLVSTINMQLKCNHSFIKFGYWQINCFSNAENTIGGTSLLTVTATDKDYLSDNSNITYSIRNINSNNLGTSYFQVSITYLLTDRLTFMFPVYRKNTLLYYYNREFFFANFDNLYYTDQFFNRSSQLQTANRLRSSQIHWLWGCSHGLRCFFPVRHRIRPCYNHGCQRQPTRVFLCQQKWCGILWSGRGMLL